MSTNWYKMNRKIHYWVSAVVIIPLFIMAGSGVLLMLKKQITWVQPPTVKGVGTVPALSFNDIIEISKSIPEAEIESWKNVNRLDVRPGKGVVKVRSKNDWEIQVDLETGKILNVDLRRSDLIESIHDGSFFHQHVKLGFFLPCAVLMLVICATGGYLFYVPFSRKKRKPKRKNNLANDDGRFKLKEKQHKTGAEKEIKKAA